MICPNCKNEIPDGCAFCPICGNPVAAEETAAQPAEAPAQALAETAAEVPAISDAQVPAVPKKKKTGLIIGICAAVAALVVAGIAVFGSNPLALVKEAAQNTMSAGTERVKEVQKQTTVTVSCDLQSLTASLLGFELPAGADIVISADAESKASMLKADIKLMGSSFLDASAFIGKDGLVISSDALLGDAYGIDFSNAKENLPGSILDPANGILSQEQYDSFVSALEHRNDTEDFAKELNTVMEKAAEQIGKSVEKNSKASKEKGELNFGTKGASVDMVKVEINAKQLAEIAEDTVEYLKNDAEFRNSLDGIVADYPELIESMTGKSADAAMAEFNDALAKFDKQDILKDYEEKDIVISAYFSINASRELVGVNCDFPKDDMSFEAIMGPEAGNASYMSFDYSVDGETGKVCYQVSENSDSAYSAAITVDMEELDDINANISWNKASGDFTVQCEDVTVKASVTEADGIITIDPKSIEGMGLEAYSDYLDLVTVTVSRQADIPEEPKFKEVLTMSEEDIQGIIDEITASFYTALYTLAF